MTRALTLLGYAVIVVAAICLEITARRRGRGRFAAALSVALRWWPLRVLLLAGWLWLGWHTFVRVDWR
jgi:hypothetical protein